MLLKCWKNCFVDKSRFKRRHNYWSSEGTKGMLIFNSKLILLLAVINRSFTHKGLIFARSGSFQSPLENLILIFCQYFFPFSKFDMSPIFCPYKKANIEINFLKVKKLNPQIALIKAEWDGNDWTAGTSPRQKCTQYRLVELFDVL